jgi:hypothetical protein
MGLGMSSWVSQRVFGGWRRIDGARNGFLGVKTREWEFEPHGWDSKCLAGVPERANGGGRGIDGARKGLLRCQNAQIGPRRPK